MTLPVVMSASGPVVTDTTVIRQQLDTDITALAPGYTSILPGTLIEDILSTDCGAVAACDQARVDAINSLTPYGVNLYLLNQLAAVRGITRITQNTMQVYLRFSGGAGWVIPKGFTVSDGTYTYVTQNTVIIGSGGITNTLALAIATTSGAWTIPANTVIFIDTNIPPGSGLTVNNPSAGDTAGPEDNDTFRARVLAAQNFGVQGSPGFIQAAVSNVPGVLLRTVNTLAYSTGYLVTAFGGDPYDVALAIYQSVGDITLLRGSLIVVSAVSNSNPGVITTSTSHGLISGNSVTIQGSTGITSINGTFTATVINDTQFSIPVDTTQAATYTGGGFLSNDPRVQTVTINDAPNEYTIPYIIPLSQLIGVAMTWNAPAEAAASQELIASLAAPAIVSYVNSLQTGASLNLLSLQLAILNALSPSIDVTTLSRLELAITVDGTPVAPPTGSYLVPIDTLSYPYTNASNVTIQRG